MLKYIFLILFLIFFLETVALLQIPDGKFHIIACNVGQGDATLIIYKKVQILIDGGPDNKVLSCLGKYLPFWDRELEMVVLTHPDSDHFTGLSEVFKRYKVDNYLSNPVSISKPEYKALENTVGGMHPHAIYPETGMDIKAGLIHFYILSPSGDKNVNGNTEGSFMNVTDQSTNEMSIVSLVSFGNFKAVLTGDMNPLVSDGLAASWMSGPVNYIKMSHHGSKNGTTDNLLKTLEPELAVISVGKNNYGQPAREVLDNLDNLRIKYLRTDKNGDVEVISDGKGWRIR